MADVEASPWKRKIQRLVNAPMVRDTVTDASGCPFVTARHEVLQCLWRRCAAVIVILLANLWHFVDRRSTHLSTLSHSFPESTSHDFRGYP